MFQKVIFLACFVVFIQTAENYFNTFERTLGCLQYNGKDKDGYKYAHPYFATALFRNIRVGTNNVTEMRMGLLNEAGYFRFSPEKYPYNTVMYELVLFGCSGTRSAIQQYTRRDPEKYEDEVMINETPNYGMSSDYSPFMFTMSINPNGLIELTADEDTEPFMRFSIANFTYQYVSFANQKSKTIFFFDCPFERTCDCQEDLHP